MAIHDDPASMGFDRANGDPCPAPGPGPNLSRNFARLAVILGHARIVAFGPGHDVMLSPALWTAPDRTPPDSPADRRDAWTP